MGVMVLDAGSAGGLELEELPLLLLEEHPDPFTLLFLTCRARCATGSGLDEETCNELETEDKSIGS